MNANVNERTYYKKQKDTHRIRGEARYPPYSLPSLYGPLLLVLPVKISLICNTNHSRNYEGAIASSAVHYFPINWQFITHMFVFN